MNEEPIVRLTAMDAGQRRVQPGWMVQARDGEELGEVTEMDSQYVYVTREGLTTPRHLRLPPEVIAEEDETEMRAILSIGADEADEYEI